MIYSISELENLSGVKAHTIRAWEQRYQLLEPKRTDTNIRYYEDEDLRQLLNIVFLKKNGFRISDIAKMDCQTMTTEIDKLSSTSTKEESIADALIIAMMELDESKFHQLLSSSIQQHGMEIAMLDVVLPFLSKVSALWLTGSVTPTHDNFATYLIRQKLIVALDTLPYPKATQKNFVLYMPEEGKQELSLLFIQYLLKSRGFNTIYLGQNSNVSDLGVAIEAKRPHYILGLISAPIKNISTQTYIKQLSQACPEVHWLFTGVQITTSKLIPTSENVTLLTGFNDTIDFISKL